ncbi:MAG: ATP-dependent DNA helicase RecG [Candidatus Paceibacterota bacterium]|nr:ATP-dependent DNA helicase RecG [Candidatus Paceibacterota bacterium]
MLNIPIENIYRIGPSYKKRFKKLGIETINDLLFHFPSRYDDFSKIISISNVKSNEVCTIKGEVVKIGILKTWKKKMFITEALIKDKTGTIRAIWFSQPYLTKTLKEKDGIFLSGKVSGDKMLNPVYEKIGEKEAFHTGRLTPVYPETAGVSSKWIRSLISISLSKYKDKFFEILPEEVIKENNFLTRKESITQVHFPSSEVLAKKARERFAFEELFLIQLFVLRERAKLSKEKAISLPINLNNVKPFVENLPFKLTNAQKKCSWRILKDMEKDRPMNRLLQGDVGSGKTVVGAIAALNAIKAGYQVAFMAPTEILVKQHFKEIFNLLKNFNVNIGLLTGKEDKFYSKKLKNSVIEISRKKLLEMALGKTNEKTGKIQTGIDILIGTHALIQDKVKFGKLALVVLDEQHRFGVKQRAKLCKKKGEVIIPHLLSMTATPIPRTLALTVYGDLDLSLIDELPKGRKKIITEVIKPDERKKYYNFIRKEIKKGRQVFVICPRIEASEKEDIQIKAVKEEYKRLKKEVFPDLNILMLHGKMKTKEKEKIMDEFKRNKGEILVSTSVIEVGIDIPNATVMVIEGAERFGLSQLHQFRGRVGRGKFQSYCFLFTDSSNRKTYERLRALVSSENGFELAEKDLEMRGPGDFIGVRQWGMPDRVMSSLKNLPFIEKTRESAKKTLQKDPFLKKNFYLGEGLKRLREKIHLE